MESTPNTVVLVHGAWHDERCWSEVTAELDVRRVPWASLTLPSTDPVDRTGLDGAADLPGFADDVAAVLDLLDGLDGAVTLCGHGYGGMVISEAGNHDRVERLVYLAAYCPRPGQSVLDLTGGREPAVSHQADGRMTARPARAARLLYNDLDPDRAASKEALLRPSTAAIHRTPAINPAWETKEATFVAGRADRVIGRRRAHRMGNRLVRNQIARGRAATHLATLDTGHCPFFSAPGQVADLVASATVLRTGSRG